MKITFDRTFIIHYEGASKPWHLGEDAAYFSSAHIGRRLSSILGVQAGLSILNG